MIRSILAVVAGYLFMLVSIVLFYAVAPPVPSVVSSPSFMVTTIIFGLIVALVGGFITGAIAKRKALLHAAILSSIILAVSAVNIISSNGSEPMWFLVANTMSSVLGVLAGGFIQKKLK